MTITVDEWLVGFAGSCGGPGHARSLMRVDPGSFGSYFFPNKPREIEGEYKIRILLYARRILS